MSPTVRFQPAVSDLDRVHPAPIPRRVRVYAWSLLVLVVGAAVGPLIGGASLPAPGAVLLLAVPLALCMNRFVWFPNETGATADAAVVVAAMVVFRTDAPWLGPLLLALLAGVLDGRHWSDRAFTRMAYNAGSTALSALLAVAVFDLASTAWGSSAGAVVGAAAVAAVPYLLAESVLGVTLVTLLGESPRAAVAHQLPVNALVIPFAVYGGLAGLAVLEVGWWLGFAVLLGAHLLPELLVVELPRRTGRPAIALAVAGALLLVGAASREPLLRVAVGVLALGLLACVECGSLRAAAGSSLAPLVAALGVGASFDTSAAGLRGASIAAAAVLVLVLVRDRRAAWATTLVAMTVGVTAVAATAGASALLLAVASTAALLVAPAAWGPLPWPSRGIGPLGERIPARVRDGLAVALWGASAAVVGVAALVAEGSRHDVAVAAATLCEVSVSVALLRVRWWRFDPRRRRIEVAVLAAAALAIVCGYLPLAFAGSVLAPGVAAIVLAAAGAVLHALRPRRERRDASEELDVAHRQ